MFDHVKFGVSDYAASKAFFQKALAPLGVTACAEGEPAYGIELCAQGQLATLCLFQTDEKPAHLHLAFMAQSRQQEDEFYRAALAAGGQDNGPPGLRPKYHANGYAAFVIGPDGHNIEARLPRAGGLMLRWGGVAWPGPKRAFNGAGQSSLHAPPTTPRPPSRLCRAVV